MSQLSPLWTHKKGAKRTARPPDDADPGAQARGYAKQRGDSSKRRHWQFGSPHAVFREGQRRFKKGPAYIILGYWGSHSNSKLVFREYVVITCVEGSSAVGLWEV